MKNEEINLIINRYNKRLNLYGHDPRTLGWPKKRHFLRYEILLSQWDLNGKEVLDYGCGFGDMYEYAIKRGIKLIYEGVDINEKLLIEGQKKYKNINLYKVGGELNQLNKSYDYILSSGVYNLKLSENWKNIESAFELFNKYSKFGFALNFLSNRVEYELEETYHSDPVKILDLAYKYSNRVILRNDYMPFDFTIFVDKRNEFDKSIAVYPDFLKFIPE